MNKRKHYGRKIKKTKNLYRKRKTAGQKVFGTVATVLGVSAIAFFGFCIGKPVLDYLSSIGTRERPDWSPQAQYSQEQESGSGDDGNTGIIALTEPEESTAELTTTTTASASEKETTASEVSETTAVDSTEETTAAPEVTSETDKPESSAAHVTEPELVISAAATTTTVSSAATAAVTTKAPETTKALTTSAATEMAAAAEDYEPSGYDHDYAEDEADDGGVYNGFYEDVAEDVAFEPMAIADSISGFAEAEYAAADGRRRLRRRL